MTLRFAPISPDARPEVQRVSLGSGLRNCNFTFANLYGWQLHYSTEFCIADDALVLRFLYDGCTAHMVCSRHCPSPALLRELAGADGRLCLLGPEDERATQIAALLPQGCCTIQPLRDNYDYLYLRSELALMQGKNLKNKRNHVNKFRAEHPGFEYLPLRPSLFAQCMELERLWRDEGGHSNPAIGDTLAAEQQAMQRVFAHWDDLGMTGGAVFAEGRMVAFTYGAPVTDDTFDVCVEKADRTVDGAFSIINQQFAAHLPERFTYLNREEDMGLEGLRKAKLSYHPVQLLTYNLLQIRF